MYLLADIGGTNTRITISSKDTASIDKVATFKTPTIFDKALAEILEQTKVIHPSLEFEAAVFGVPGPLNQTKSEITTAPNLPDWNNQPLKENLTDIFDTEVYLENDADLAALGESYYGAGRNFKTVAYMTISTGIGGSRVIDNKIDHGLHSFEPGHQIIDISEDGATKTLEDLIGGNNIEKNHNAKAESITDSEVWSLATKHLAIGLNNITVHWSPDCIVLGGPIMNSINLEQLNQEFEQLVKIYPDKPALKLSELKDEVGLYGALSFVNSL